MPISSYSPPGCLQIHHDRAYRRVSSLEITLQEEAEAEALEHLNAARTQIASAIAHLDAAKYRFLAEEARKLETLVISEMEY